MLVNPVESGGYYCYHLAESIDLEEHEEMQAGRWIYSTAVYKRQALTYFGTKTIKI